MYLKLFTDGDNKANSWVDCAILIRLQSNKSDVFLYMIWILNKFYNTYCVCYLDFLEEKFDLLSQMLLLALTIFVY